MLTRPYSFKLLFFSVLFAAAGFCLYGIFFSYIGDKNREFSAATFLIESAEENELKLRSLKTTINETKEQREQLDTYFIREDAVVDFIETVEELGRVTGTELSVSSVELEPSTEEYPSTLRISVDTRGTWKNQYQLLLLLETLPYHINLTGVRLQETPGPVVEWKGSYTIEVTAS
jgi:hypothetical protein